jgi:hypothetical protein
VCAAAIAAALDPDMDATIRTRLARASTKTLRGLLAGAPAALSGVCLPPSSHIFFSERQRLIHIQTIADPQQRLLTQLLRLGPDSDPHAQFEVMQSHNLLLLPFQMLSAHASTQRSALAALLCFAAIDVPAQPALRFACAHGPGQLHRPAVSRAQAAALLLPTASCVYDPCPVHAATAQAGAIEERLARAASTVWQLWRERAGRLSPAGNLGDEGAPAVTFSSATGAEQSHSDEDPECDEALAGLAAADHTADVCSAEEQEELDRWSGLTQASHCVRHAACCRIRAPTRSFDLSHGCSPTN